ncbi:MAG TPA: nucleotide sugar dehydrogenase [Bacteroidetes bacterium]|nr:nucleotide sugar dehydrogenase [Bacteroidota bacterium]
MSYQNTDNNSHRDELLERINSRRARFGVVGLGYVGLPLAVGFAETGMRVTGIELDPEKVRMINRGENFIGDVDPDLLARLVAEKRLDATDSFDVLDEIDVIIICVPTPLNKTGDPDISAIVSVRNRIREHLHAPQLIVLESTTYPGSVSELILPYLSETGLKIGEDFFLAFSPERIDPNNPTYQVVNTPKVVGGVTSACTQTAVAAYGQLVKRVVPVSSPATAEMVKLLENTFRSINIGLANEVAIMCRILGLDVWEVIEAAATKPFGFMPFYPGPGLGGHCIPVDPSYLSWKLRALKYRTRFIELATEINSTMPEYVLRLAMTALNDEKKALKGSKVLLLGVAYKRDIDDLRESPALDVLRLLDDIEADIAYTDPHVPMLNHGSSVYECVELTPTLLSDQDIVIIITDHTAIDYNEVCRHARLVLDTRNATRNVISPAARIVKL